MVGLSWDYPCVGLPSRKRREWDWDWDSPRAAGAPGRQERPETDSGARAGWAAGPEEGRKVRLFGPSGEGGRTLFGGEKRPQKTPKRPSQPICS